MNNLSVNSFGPLDNDATQVPTPKAINPSNLLLPFKSSSDGIPKWSSHSVLPWVEAIAKRAEDTDRRGPVIVGESCLSEPSKSPYESFAPSTTIPPSLFSTDSNHLQYQTSWDLSYIEEIDIYAGLFLGQIRPLAARYENLLASDITNATTPIDKEALNTLYAGIKDRLKHHFNEIVKSHCSIPMIDDVFDLEASQTHVGDLARTDLDALYDQTTAKLHSMFLNLQKQLFGNTVETETATSASSKTPLPKNELGSYMTAWLRKNFTNPYPDDDELNRMAQHCGTTTKIISNWLINARTRKWRPAIQKACNLGRPADMLLEDSINFFDGSPIRPHSASSSFMQNSSPAPSSSGEYYNYHSYEDDSEMYCEYYASGGQSSKRMKY